MKAKKLTKVKLKKLEKRQINKKFKEWAKSVKERDGNKCIICGKTERLNAHHIIPREIKEFRFDTDNGVTLCPKDHKWRLLISAHRNPFTFYIWLEKYRTEQFKRL